MTKKPLIIIAGFIVAIPVLILLSNLVVFAFVGHGFLIEGDGEINGARGMVGWLSATGAVLIFGFGSLNDD